ncbi:MAG TPA: hypothetical protein VN688_14115 [Gemmataceae bacterium]|nr:hypothetical protein [Gemmataceae bacterium]
MKRTPPRIRLNLEPLEDRIVPSAMADIQMTGATTTDARTVSVNYNITDASLAGQTVNFNIYRSVGYESVSGAQLIGTASIPGSDSADLSVGQHQGVKLALMGTNGQPLTALTPNTALPFIVVVANPNGTIAESNSTNNTASFETHVLGVVVHGLAFNLLRPTTPAWETQMAAGLRQDGYEAVIAFNWVRLSISFSPSATGIAAGQLLGQIQTQADQLAAQHPGDVVDINFIGHSRGNVVISETLQDLLGTSDPALRGGYMQMTMLDPHPANNLSFQFNWLLGNDLADTLAEVVLIFQFLAHDPQVIVPPNVSHAEVFDQQTLAGALFNYRLEILLNLWGETAASIPNQSAQPIAERNLTNVIDPALGRIGHSEVHDWYMAHVVDTNETFTYFG